MFQANKKVGVSTSAKSTALTFWRDYAHPGCWLEGHDNDDDDHDDDDDDDDVFACMV